jgi:hypothetical protein
MAVNLFNSQAGLRYVSNLCATLCNLCLQAEVKQQLLLTPARAYRGYQPLGTNVTRHEMGFTPDWHEALDFFR